MASCGCGGCSGCCGRFCRKHLLKLLLWLSIVGGVGMGVALRSVAPFDQPKLHPRQLMYLGFPGELMMRVVGLLTLPLVGSNLIASVSALGIRASHRVGLRTLCYYFTSTLIAVILGVLLALTIKPGTKTTGYTPPTHGAPAASISEDLVLDVIRNLFPDSWMNATSGVVRTKVDFTNVVLGNNTNETQTQEHVSLEVEGSFNVLGVAVFCLMFGMAIASMGEKGRPLLDLFVATSDGMMTIYKTFMWLYPIGIFSMMACRVIMMERPGEALESLAVFVATVLFGLFSHAIMILPLIYLILTRQNPYKVIGGAKAALLTASATTNSYAALPVAVKCVETELEADPRIARLVLTMGAAVNMQGCALYYAVAAISVAQLRGVTLLFQDVALLSVTITCATLVAPAIGGGRALYAVILGSVGLPTADIAYLMAVDTLLSRLRSAVNTLGDCFGVGIVGHMSRGDLDGSDVKEDIELQEVTNAPQTYSSADTLPVRFGRKLGTTRIENAESGQVVLYTKL